MSIASPDETSTEELNVGRKDGLKNTNGIIDCCRLKTETCDQVFTHPLLQNDDDAQIVYSSQGHQYLYEIAVDG